VTIGGVTLTEGADFAPGASNDVIGAAFAALGVAPFETALGADLDAVAYDGITDTLTFTFGAGVDFADGGVFAASNVTLGGDTGALAVTAGTDVAYAAEGDAVDTFVYDLNAVGSVDTITDFDTTWGGASAVDDLLDFTALGLTGGWGLEVIEALADGDAMVADGYTIYHDDLGSGDATFYADVNGDAAYNQADDVTIVLTGCANGILLAQMLA
jgi:hypothetical protein